VRPTIFFVLLVSLRGEDPQLEHARRVNLDRAGNLPNFVADEIAVRYKSRHVDPPQWKLADTIESEIAVRGSGFTRQRTTVNGKAWTKPNLPDGTTWSVSFGSELKPLFGPDCHTTIEYSGREEIHGKTGLAYRFQSPPDGCFGTLAIKNGLFSFLKVANPARTGRFLIDDPSGNLIYFEIEAKDFPKGFDGDPFLGSESWENVKIGDATYLLPVASEMFTGFKRGDLWHITVEYKNHRHFESSTNVTFK
jgi:hypothetical protein